MFGKFPRKLKISHRLLGGFGIVLLLLTAVVGTTVWKTAEIKKSSALIVELRVPSALAHAQLINSINGSLAALRGYMLTGDPKFKTERAIEWRNIARLHKNLEKYSTEWANSENSQKMQRLKKTFREFKRAQAEIEKVAHSKDEEPAKLIFVNEAAPLAQEILQSISAIINDELENAKKSRSAFAGRSKYLDFMTDFRGSFNSGLSNLRVFLSTGETKFADKFSDFWETNRKQLASLNKFSAKLSLKQQVLLKKLTLQRAEFSLLPPKMVAIRTSPKWNMANYLLVTKAVPRAEKLLNILDGERGPDGIRRGGMVANQLELLRAGANNGNVATQELLLIEQVLLIIGILFSATVAFFTIRAIANPVVEMTEAMKKLAAGHLDTVVPSPKQQDEIGDMAIAVQVFKDSAIRNKALEFNLENLVAERTRQLEEKAAALDKSESRLTELLELVPEAIVSVDDHGLICLFNQSAETLFGYKKQELIGQPLERLLPDRFRHNHRNKIHSFAKSDISSRVMSERSEVLGLKKDGTEFSARGSISKLTFEGSNLYTVLIQDITEQKNIAEALESHNNELRQRDLILQAQNQRFDAAISAMSHGLAMFDKDENLIISNDRYAEIYKLSPEQIDPGMNLREILEMRVENGSYFGSTVDEIVGEMRALKKTRTAKPKTYVLNDNRHVEIRNQLMDNGGWLSIQEDVTERYNSEKKIKYLADYDTLTDLPNRTQINAALKTATRQASEDGTEMALLYIDLDGFKEVNDTLGHPVGDHVLNVIGSRLAEFQSDTVIAGRLSGDEFVMIVREFNYRPYLERLANRICTTLAMPIHAQHDVIVLSASIGISIGPPEDGDEDTLTQYSDLALYQAKTDGGNSYRFFEHKMYVRAKERQRLAADLRNAIRKNELVVHYQPQVDLRTGKINGYEALVRWQHDELGMISPFQFIGLAEETGQISEIGEWVLRTACEYACEWPNKEKVSVNLSPIQFKRQDVSTMVKRVLWETGLEPERLELEITESVLIQSTDSVIIVLRTLAEMGVSIALDDFGTGFSSLSYLTTFPFNKIKIDKTFIDDLGKDTEVTAIVAMIVGLGRTLDTVITAEGIEEFRQHELLRASGCDQGQGYLYGKPEPRILEQNHLDLHQVA